jgi:hypothetical protein
MSISKKKTAAKRSPAKKAAPKKAVKKIATAAQKTAPQKQAAGKGFSKANVGQTGTRQAKAFPTKALQTEVPDGVSIRMYCLGTGDCFLVRFNKGDDTVFTMMIDCGSCRGNQKDFQPYIDNLVDALPDKTIDLLVVTHEHNDHVNGFAKCIESFEQLTIREAWFAWTENPVDPGGAAAELKKKQQKMKCSLSNAIQAIAKSDRSNAAKAAFLNGLNTLADINLPSLDPEDPENPQEEGPGPLPGMK